MRWDAALNRTVRDKDGKSQGTERAHLEAAARSGSVTARKELESPVEYPDALRYLHEWILELYGRSGLGMSGYAPLSYSEIMAWALLTGRLVAPWEVDALIQLDAVLRHPGIGEEGNDNG